jgi:hypothetical protein
MTEQTKEFYKPELVIALKDCQTEGYDAMCMPELAKARTDGVIRFDNWYTSLSAKETGKTKQGNEIVLFNHGRHYLSTHENIAAAIETGLVNGAGILIDEQKVDWFAKDLKAAEDGNKKIVIADPEKLRKAKYGLMSVDEAREHPISVPFFGDKETANGYFDKHLKNVGNQIRIYNSDDLGDKPVGRLLFLGGINYYVNLDGSNYLGSCGHFFGVRRGSDAAGGADAQKVAVPSLDEILAVSKDFVPKAAWSNFEATLRKKYE